MTRKLAAYALIASLGGCGSEPAGPGEQAQRIVGGEPSGAEQDGVVLLRIALDDGKESVCTASLVAPNLVVTARHCVAYVSEGLFRCNTRGELTDNTTGGGRLGLHLPADRIEVFERRLPRKAPLARGEQIISTLSPTICVNDIAFVLLDQVVNLPLVPLRLGRPAEREELTVLVGFGMDEEELAIDYETQLRRQRRDLRIAAIGVDSLGSATPTAPPRSLILRGPSGCIGDSGGPLLAQATGALLGIYSLQSGASCSSATVIQQLVHVPPFEALIAEAFEAAGAEPVPESAPHDDGGAGGAAPAPEPPTPAGGAADAGSGGEAPQPTGEPRARGGLSGCGFGPPVGKAYALWLLALPVLRRRQRRL